MTPRSLVSVTGGAYSISADVEALTSLAGVLAGAARILAEHAAGTLRAATEPASIGSAALDPAGAFDVATHTVATVACLGAAALEADSLAAALRAAGLAYCDADKLRTELVPLLHAATGLPRTMWDLARAPADLLSGHGARLQRIITDNPSLVNEALVGGASVFADIVSPERLLAGGPLGGGLLGGGLLGGGLLGGSSIGQRPPIAAVAHAAAGHYADGRPLVTVQPMAATADTDGAPRSLSDLVRGLAVRNNSESDPRSGGGMIDVRIVGQSDGSRSIIVDLPGTTRWDVDPRQHSPQVGDFGTNLRALAGDTSVYLRGVEQALALAGATAADPILLVGHSQGGLIAAQLATSLRRSGLTVTHVLTVGAPLGLATIPRSVSVLAVENRGDVVPQLDGRANRAEPNLVTVTVDEGAGTVAAKHSVETYLRGTYDVEASDDPSVTQWVYGAERFFTGTSISTTAYQLRRSP